MASGVYQRFVANALNKLVDMSAGDTIKCILLNNTHAFTGSDNTYSQVSANELATTGGYTAGGAAVGTPTVTQANPIKWDGDDVTWTSASFTAYHAVLYDDTLVGDDLIASFDFGGAQTVTGGTFTIQWNASGIVTFTPA